MLPDPVMAQLHCNGFPGPYADISIMEIGHRTESFQAIEAKLQANLRALLDVPDHYHVLLLPGGGRLQFAMVAMNLMARSEYGADYFDTGLWSSKAMNEAGRFGQVHCVSSGKQNDYRLIPDAAVWRCRDQAAYCHIVDNETAHGVEFAQIPMLNGVPIVSDMTSNILSRPIKVSDYGLIYAAAQKNIGPAGFSVVIIRDDLLAYAPDTVPTLMQYSSYVGDDSMPSTPATFAWYVALLVTEWLIDLGGLEVMAERNASKSRKLYDFIDSHDFYHAPVINQYRSRMNVVFSLADVSLQASFLQQAHVRQLYGLAGHWQVGDMRASLYNAMPEAGVDALIDLMEAFAKQYG